MESSLDEKIKTPFQMNFKVNDEFYTGNQIREAIVKHFPFRNGWFEGLAFITANCQNYYPTNEAELKKIISDEPIEVKKYPTNFHKFFLYVICEMEQWDDSLNLIVPQTLFMPSDLGYICIKQKNELI